MSSYISPTEGVGKHSFLDKQTERDLAIRWRKHGDVEARDKLVFAHLPLAYKIAGSFARKYSLDPEDLKGASVEGLLIAASKFDHTLGWRFSTYAQHWVRAKVGEECSTPAGMTPRGFAQARPSLTHLDATLPSVDDEIDDRDNHDVVADDNAPSEDDLNDILDKDRVRDALLGLDLTLRDRRIVEARLADIPVAEIAAEHCLSRQRVDQIWASLVDLAAVKLDCGRYRDPHLALNPAYPDLDDPRRVLEHGEWRAWTDRPPAELPFKEGCRCEGPREHRHTTITHIEQAAPEWFKAQSWPSDSRNARLRTWRPVPVTIPGAALMPKVGSRWHGAHSGRHTGLSRRRVNGVIRINIPGPRVERRPYGIAADLKKINAPSANQYISWQRTGKRNAGPKYLPPPRNHADNRELLVSLGVDGNVPLAISKQPPAPEKCWSWKKPPLTEMEVVGAFASIPEDAIEHGLAQLNPTDRLLIKEKFRPPMPTPALARDRRQSYAKTLPTLYRAVKRLQKAVRKPRLVVDNDRLREAGDHGHPLYEVAV